MSSRRPYPSFGCQRISGGELPEELAADIAAFITTGKPTSDLYRTDAPDNLTKIVTEAGKAIIVQRP